MIFRIASLGSAGIASMISSTDNTALRRADFATVSHLSPPLYLTLPTRGAAVLALHPSVRSGSPSRSGTAVFYSQREDSSAAVRSQNPVELVILAQFMDRSRRIPVAHGGFPEKDPSQRVGSPGSKSAERGAVTVANGPACSDTTPCPKSMLRSASPCRPKACVRAWTVF